MPLALHTCKHVLVVRGGAAAPAMLLSKDPCLRGYRRVRRHVASIPRGRAEARGSCRWRLSRAHRCPNMPKCGGDAASPRRGVEFVPETLRVWHQLRPSRSLLSRVWAPAANMAVQRVRPSEPHQPRRVPSVLEPSHVGCAHAGASLRANTCGCDHSTSGDAGVPRGVLHPRGHGEVESSSA